MPYSKKSSLLSALCLAALAVSACSGGSNSPSGSPESALAGDGDRTLEAEGAGVVKLGDPQLSGSCTDHASVARTSDQRGVTVIFSNQTFGGDPSQPDYFKDRSAGRLIGDAKSTAQRCVLRIPMTVTAGYRFSPTNVSVRGFARRGFVFTDYGWADDASKHYNFERRVPLNESAKSIGDNFNFSEPLHNLWSPTCSTSAGSQVSAEFVVSLSPYGADGDVGSLIAVDSFDVTGFGSLERCDSPTPYDRTAQAGESCGIVDQDNVHPVRCDDSKQRNLCVFPLTNQVTGTCVNQSMPPSVKPELVSGDDCGGPFFDSCSTKTPLVCGFVNGAARQNASRNYGKCTAPLAVDSQCKRELFGACDGRYTCNDTVDPCQAGSNCSTSTGTCVANKKGATADDAPANDAPANDTPSNDTQADDAQTDDANN